MIDINGTKLAGKGTVRRDTAAQALDVDLQYGLHLSHWKPYCT